MHRIAKIFCLLAIGLLAASVSATNAFAQGKVVKFSGDVTVTLPDGTQPAVSNELSLPQGSTIQTGSSGEVYIETFPGAIATVKGGSTVRIERLQVQRVGDAVSAEDAQLLLEKGTVVSVLDPNAKKKGITVNYGVRTSKGVAAAQGTAFSVSVTSDGFSIATTADKVTYTTATETVTIQAGMISITPIGQPAQPPIPLATAVSTNPQVANIVREAVATITTVVQNNIGSLSAESATNVISQVVAVAVAAIPSEGATFTSQAVQAVTASGSATAGSADTAAGAVTAAAVKAAPDQAAQLAAAAASAAPNQAGVVTAVAQQVAPQSSDSITQSVATATGQSTTAVQNSAAAASSIANAAIGVAGNATANVVTPPSSTPSGNPSTPVTQPQTTPQVPVIQPDGSNAGG